MYPLKILQKTWSKNTIKHKNRRPPYNPEYSLTEHIMRSFSAKTKFWALPITTPDLIKIHIFGNKLTLDQIFQYSETITQTNFYFESEVFLIKWYIRTFPIVCTTLSLQIVSVFWKSLLFYNPTVAKKCTACKRRRI